MLHSVIDRCQLEQIDFCFSSIAASDYLYSIDEATVASSSDICIFTVVFGTSFTGWAVCTAFNCEGKPWISAIYDLKHAFVSLNTFLLSEVARVQIIDM